MIIDNLYESVENKSCICVGLDTSIDYIPESFKSKFSSTLDAVFEFNKKIIDATFDIVSCYKVQIAYYEALGIEGLYAYMKTLKYIKSIGSVSIGDIKRGDISSTAKMYAKAHFEGDFECDFITLNPYMGFDSIEPYLEYIEKKNKGLFVLLRTSNKGAKDIQYIESKDNKKVFDHVGDKLYEMSKNYRGKYGYSSIGAVVGCTHNKEAKEIRKTYEDMFFLIPGYGAQGGSAQDVALYLKNGNGGVVNSSRAILLAYKNYENGDIRFDECSRLEALKMKGRLKMQLSYKSCKVVENINLFDDIYKLKVEGNYDIKPGQFFMLKCLTEEPILPRPISVHDFADGYVSFLYQKKGRGTNIMTKLDVNDEIKLTGPLGNGFDAEKIKGKIAVVAGGIGIAPMLYTVKSLKDCDIDLYAGFRDEIYGIDEIKKYVSNVYIATESGKYGYKGYVTDIFSPFEYNAVLCCGPEVMMEKVVKVCRNYATPVFVSMEKHMACGIGACLGCTCETKDGNKRVCKDGPVFYGRDVFIGA